MARSPEIAKGSPPETGASKKLTPFSSHFFPILSDTPGAIELISITRWPFEAPSKTPPSPQIADSA